LHLEAANPSPRTVRGYTDDGALFGVFLARQGMPTAVAAIKREHVEAFIAGELERTSASSAATRYRSLQAVLPLAGRRGRGRHLTHGEDAQADHP
jgi:hypothetical protein